MSTFARPISIVAIAIESFPLKVPFVISRGVKTEAHVVAVSLSDGTVTGRGECTPYARYGETPDSVVVAIEAASRVPDSVSSRDRLSATLPAGAARNALDCALWDLEAKSRGVTAAELAGCARPLVGLETFFTLSLGTPDAMAAAAMAASHHKLLKLKLGGAGDGERMRAVRRARPDARLVADANEAWHTDMVASLLSVAAAERFELIEQPLPADADDVLRTIARPIPVCADESVHTRGDLTRLPGCYDAVNIKLDKAGGLTEALAMRDAARAAGLKVMVGSMVATSLAIAPAFLVAQDADWVDLDGPLLLATDRDPALRVEGGLLLAPPPLLWG